MGTNGVFPGDAIARARELYEEIGSIGAYSHSQGVPFIRENVARFIEGEDSGLGRRELMMGSARRTRVGCGADLFDCWGVGGSVVVDQHVDLFGQGGDSDPDSAVPAVHCDTGATRRRCGSILSGRVAGMVDVARVGVGSG